MITYKDFYRHLLFENISDNFKKWFGKSKVVDKQGNPLIVFHGTREKFTTFDPSRVGSRFGFDKSGFFFTSDRNEARGLSFGDDDKNSLEKRLNPSIRKDADNRVMSVYLSIQNPVTRKDVSSSDGYISDTYHSPTDYYDVNRKLIEKLLVTGKFDGVVLENIGGENLYVAIRPTQIKSSNNNGDFDPNNPDINK